MISKRAYRLGEYRIAEDEHGLLWWETHFNFGVQRSGKCYIFGNVLILGPWSHEESGYLQLEFSELLNKLPVWEKTQYYCFASELLNVSTGQSLTSDFLERYIALRASGSNPSMNMTPAIFRLGRYQITIADDGDISWQKCEGFNRVIGGLCVIESDILFIDPQEYEFGNQNKQEFLNKLNQLPKWDKTIAWCRSFVLRPCHVEAHQTDNTGLINLHQYKMEEHFVNEKPSAPNLNQYQEPPKRLLLLSSLWLEKAWQRIHIKKGWSKYIIPMVVVGLLFGLIMIFHSEKKSHRAHGHKEHHHKFNH